MDTQSAIFLFLKENVCNVYLLEAALALSSVNAVHLKCSNYSHGSCEQCSL